MASHLTPEQQANFNDSRQSTIIGSFVLFLVIGNFSVLLRLVAQWQNSKRFFWEDFFVVIALICSDIVISDYLVATHFGLGLHIYRVVAEDPYNLIPLFKYQWVNSVLNGPTFLSIKLSLLFLYRRLFMVHQKWLIIFWWVNIIYNILWFFGSTGYFIFQCWPVSFYWERYYTRFHLDEPYPISGQCNATSTASVAVPLIMGMISDWALLAMPIATLGRLNRSWKKRLALIAIFSVGLLACLLELIRIIIVEVRTDDATDPTWGIVDFVILTCGAENIAIMCACAPLIAALWKSQMDRLAASRANSSGSGFRLRYLFVNRQRSGYGNLSDPQGRNAASARSDQQPAGQSEPAKQVSEYADSAEIPLPGTVHIRTDLHQSSVRV